MDILVSGVRALVLPFTGGDNNEQTIRAAKLAAMGAVAVLQPEELEGASLVKRITQVLRAEPAVPLLNLAGVENTTAELASLLDEPGGVPAVRAVVQPGSPRTGTYADLLQEQLRPLLAHRQNTGPAIDIFLRDDDVDEDEESLRRLLDIALCHSVPLSLAVIPARLTPGGIQLLNHYMKLWPEQLELHQHGWQHANHEPAGRKCEFGASRSFEQQYEDISQGYTRLKAAFGKRFFPAFTPPWNRCSVDTLAALQQLNFKVLSKDRGDEAIQGYRFAEISITIDLLDFKAGGAMRSPEEVLAKLIAQLEKGDRIGIMLHHKVMSDNAFVFLDQLLAELRRFPSVRFCTLQQLHSMEPVEA